MKKSVTRIGAAILGLVILFGTMTAMASQLYPDLAPNHWCYKKIMEFVDKGYIDGYEDGTMRPDQTITRAEYVKVVNNFFGFKDGKTDKKFSDISDDAWYAKYVYAAVAQGYISGYEDNTFRPSNPITRQEATVILSRILKIDKEVYPKDHVDGLAQYSDGNEVADWAYTAIHSYSVYNFINGYEDGTLRILQNVTRAETVELLHVLEQKIEIDRPYGRTKTTKMPTINVIVEAGRNEFKPATTVNGWFNNENSCKSDDVDGVYVNITTTTDGATIYEKVNPRDPADRNYVTTTVNDFKNMFFLTDGVYDVSAYAKKIGRKTSGTNKVTLKIDTIAPYVEAKVLDNETNPEGSVAHTQKIKVTLKDVIPFGLTEDKVSGVNDASAKYAWFIESGEDGFVRVGEWTSLSNDQVVETPTKYGKYKLAVSVKDNAGNSFGTEFDGEIKYDFVEDGKTEITVNYTVEYYKEELSSDYAQDVSATETKSGETDTLVRIEVNEALKGKYEGFTLNETESTLEGTITASGDLVLKVYYTRNSYVIVWQNEDGTVLEKDENVLYGTMPSYDGEEPSKVATAEYTYEFKGWTPEISSVTGNATYKAEYTATKNKYTITWVDEDGTTVLEKDENVLYGTMPSYDGEEPSKVATAEYTYEFKGWTPEISSVTGNATYKAEYTATKNKYTITWVDEDGTTVLEKDENVEYGTMPSYDGEKPTKEATAEYTYEFKGWTPEISSVTGNATYKAEYTATKNKYTITWVDEDGTTVLEEDENVEYGTMPSYDGEKPIKEATAEYTYKFKGWTPEVSSVTGNATYTATYNATRIEGTLIANIKCNYPTEDGVKAEPGKTLKYTITLEESGDISEYPKEIKIKLDSGDVDIDIEELEKLPNVKYDEDNNTIIWTVDSKDDELTYNVKVKKETPAGEKVETTITGAEARGDKLVAVEATVKVKVDKNKNIVLVLDVSGSMDYRVYEDKITEKCTNRKCHERHTMIDGVNYHYQRVYKGTRLEVMQEAAKNFANSIIGARNSENITITIITFAGGATVKGIFRNPTEDDINSVIGELDTSWSGTNTNGAVQAATSVLKNELMLDNAVDYVVVLSDGEPNNGNYCTDETLNAFYATKANAYAIGLGDSYKKEELLKIVNNDSSKLFDAADADKLEEAFRKIGSEINKAQTSEGEIDVNVTGIKLYPIKLTYKDTALKTVDVTVESGDLESNHLSITEDGKLVWDISEYPGCTGFQIEVNRTKIKTQMLSEDGYGIKDIILVYGDPSITEEFTEDEEIAEPATSESGDVKVESTVSGESETEPSTSESGDVKVEEPGSGESDTKPATSESGDTANEEQNVVKEEQVKEEAQEPQIEENEQQEEKEQEETIKNAEEETKPTTEEAVAPEIKDPLEDEEQDEEAA